MPIGSNPSIIHSVVTYDPSPEISLTHAFSFSQELQSPGKWADAEGISLISLRSTWAMAGFAGKDRLQRTSTKARRRFVRKRKMAKSLSREAARPIPVAA